MASIAQEWVASRGTWAPVALVLVHATSLAICFPFAIAFEVLAGALFGMKKGTILVMAAKTLGASMAFLVARAILRPKGKAGDRSIQDEGMKKSTSAVMISSIARGVERDGWKFVFLARLSPLPSYTLNYGLAATKIHFGAFIVATALGQSLFVWQNVSMGYAVVQASKNDAWSMIKRWAIPAISSIIIARKVASYAKDYSEVAVQGKDHRSTDNETKRERKDVDTPESSKAIVSPGNEGSVRRSARLRRTKR